MKLCTTSKQETVPTDTVGPPPSTTRPHRGATLGHVVPWRGSCLDACVRSLLKLPRSTASNIICTSERGSLLRSREALQLASCGSLRLRQSEPFSLLVGERVSLWCCQLERASLSGGWFLSLTASWSASCRQVHTVSKRSKQTISQG